ncbi:hypothetical protein DBR22_20920 [Arthrobacter sp. HMWF013]|nr:hypothetical protein DBR22_20920 [Arthrobacter sp. HMWF013]
MTLRDVALDPKALENALASELALLDRVRYLALLNRESEALREGLQALEGSPDRGELLLVLAQVFLRQYRWHEAAALQEEALQLVSTRAEEAHVRHHIGRRLFDEALYGDAAAEFEWAADLYRVSGRHQLAERSKQAMERCRQLRNQTRANHPGAL